MPGGGKSKNKAKTKAKTTKSAKDVLTNLATSRNPAHHSQGQTTSTKSAVAGGRPIARTFSRGSVLAQKSFSPFHMRNASRRAALLKN